MSIYGTKGFNLENFIFNKELRKKIDLSRKNLAKADKVSREAKWNISMINKSLDSGKWNNKPELKKSYEMKLNRWQKKLKKSLRAILREEKKIEELSLLFKKDRD